MSEFYYMGPGHMPMTAHQHNAEHCTPVQFVEAAGLSSLKCHETKAWDYHIFKKGSKKGDKCKCGKAIK